MQSLEDFLIIIFAKKERTPAGLRCYGKTSSTGGVVRMSPLVNSTFSTSGKIKLRKMFKADTLATATDD